MRDRLVELLKKIEKEPAITCPAYKTDKTCEDCKYSINDSLCNHIERQVDYLIANDVVALPCKVGDRVWAIRKYKGVSHPQESVVSDMYFTRNMELMIVVKYVARGIWGKTVFRTKEEAERALKGGKV